ncbi:MAG TPA: acyl-CoA desaturase [Polyangia bacterium]
MIVALWGTCALYYFTAGLAVNLGYHRLLAHRSLSLPKGLERLFVTLGLGAGTPVQWTGNHRQHHARVDRKGDPHSPRLGFWHAHNGWYIGARSPWLCAAYALAGPLRLLFDGWHRPRSNREHEHLAVDVAADRYYRFLGRPNVYLAIAVAHVAFVFGGATWVWGVPGLLALWVTLVVIYNLGDAVDSVGHLFGTQPFLGAGRARNNRVLGWFALGDGWHANHHRFPWSARHGLFPGQVDWTDGAIRALEWLGLARKVRRASAEDLARAWRPEQEDLEESTHVAG